MMKQRFSDTRVSARSVSGWISVCAALLAAPLSAQDYPVKPLRIITAGAGGPVDFSSRQIAQGVSSNLGQPIVVDNRTGVLAAEAVSKAPPDGYTLGVLGGAVWIASLLRPTPYDVAKDLAPVTQIERTVNVVAVHPSLPVKSIKELIALAKSRPGQLNYSSDAIAGRGHLSAEVFKSMTGVNIVHVPYKGPAPATVALVSGEVQLFIFDLGLLGPHAKSGKVRALAVTSSTPSPLAPELPTVAASGVPGYESVGISGLFAPARTPAAIINRLNAEVVRFLGRPEVKERFFNAGAELVTGTPEQFASAVALEITKWGKVIKAANIKAD
jgi:tripartite-type tricarboxylate transporter receptor subunit TctC